MRSQSMKKGRWTISGGSVLLHTNASKMVESIAHKNSLRIGREAVDARGCGPDDKAACRTILWPGGPCAQIKVTYLTDCDSLSDNVILICPHRPSRSPPPEEDVKDFDCACASSHTCLQRLLSKSTWSNPVRLISQERRQ